MVSGAFRLSLLASIAWTTLAGQTVKEFRYNGSGYATFGVGRCQHGYANYSFGGGADGFLWRGLTLGGDIGVYQFADDSGRPFGIGTLNVGYHFVDRRAPGKWEPFVAVGLLGVGFTGHGAGAAGFIGGGVNYWFKRHIGLRTEFRATGFAEEAIAMFRVGFSFR